MIFNLFKSKPTLKELIPENFVDIHSHILPGIDDGARNIEESMVLISEMKNMGFSKIIGTPHTYPGLYDNTNESIKNSYVNLIKNLSLDIDLCYSSEYMIDKYLIKKAENKTILTLKEDYVLVEMSFNSEPLNLYEIIFNLNTNGYKPILAHPERYLFMQNKISDYHNLKDRGLNFQLNLLSLTGYYGKNILEFSEKLLNEGLIDFTGSDIHNMRHIKQFDQKVLIKNINRIEEIIEKNSLFR